MTKLSVLLVSGGFLMTSLPQQSPDLGAKEIVAVQKLAEGNAAFAVDLYGKLGAKEGNVFFSPFSVTAALGMTAAGARGGTATEMEQVLHFPARDASAHSTLGLLTRHLGGRTREKAGYEFAIANRLWGQKGHPFRDAYLALVKDQYGAALQPADFVGSSESERKAINRWVEEQTRERIKDLFAPGMIDPMSVLVLVNAIYFKGDWEAQFDRKATREAPFAVSATEKVSVPMMNRKGDYAFGETPNAQVLDVPYKGGELSMVVILPKTVDGLAALEKGLTADGLKAFLAAVGTKQEVEVSLPRFRMEFGATLNDPLKDLGIRAAFDAQAADFTGIAPRTAQGGLYVSVVVHKAFVEVNEEGTEAAAATGVGMKCLSMGPEFRADHPFLFLIRHVKTGSILFMGRLAKP